MRGLDCGDDRTPARPAAHAGGSLPNDVFTDALGLPTVWVPHSYPGCNQHAPDEHVLAPLMREGLAIMTGIFWDTGQGELANEGRADRASAGRFTPLPTER